MKGILIGLLALVTSQVCLGNDTTKVLFIGNSFIATNNLPSMFSTMCTAAGTPVQCWSHAPGGASVGDLFPNSYAHMDDPNVFTLIRSQAWDFVVVQDNQGRFVYDKGVFHPQARTISGHEKLMDSLRYYHSCAEMVLFSGWGFKNGLPPYGNTGAEMIDRIYANYLFLNGSLQQIVSPIGISWKRALAQLPSLDLWSADESHPSVAGTYLAAATLYVTLFRKNIEQTPYSPSLDSVTARQLRKIAYKTVTDSLLVTGLANYCPHLQLSNDTLTATSGYASYRWYKETMLYAITTANYIPVSQQGIYSVVGITIDSCKETSFEISYNLTDIQATEKRFSIGVYPNPSQAEVTIMLSERPAQPCPAFIYSIEGRLVAQHLLKEKQNTYDIRHYASGIYVLVLFNGNHYTKKLIQKL